MPSSHRAHRSNDALPRARNPADGRPDQRPEAFEPCLRIIRQRSDVVLNITIGGAPNMTVEERVRPAAVWKPEFASMNMGSMNFGLFPMLKRFTEFKHDWEPAMLESSRDFIFRNTYKDIEYGLDMLDATGARDEFECYDTAHLHNLHHFYREGRVKAPLFIQTMFGLLGGIGPRPDAVMHKRRTADRLFGDAYRWSVLGAGASQMRIAAMTAAMGGHVRVGLEDSRWLGRGRLAESNAAQVTQVRRIVEGSASRSRARTRHARSCRSRAAIRSASSHLRGRCYERVNRVRRDDAGDSRQAGPGREPAQPVERPTR